VRPGQEGHAQPCQHLARRDKGLLRVPAGFGAYPYPGRAIYIVDFDAKTPAVTNAKVIANEALDRNVNYLYPRWTKDQSAVVYQSSKSGRNQLYMYRLKDGRTVRVSANPKGKYMFPYGEATAK